MHEDVDVDAIFDANLIDDGGDVGAVEEVAVVQEDTPV